MSGNSEIELKNFSSFKIGGPADNFLAADSPESIVTGLKKWRRGIWSRRKKIFILGGGTNILWDDKGFGGLVLKPEITTLERDGAAIKVGAGVSVADLLNFAAENNLSGLEWAGGLPGTVGGAVFGNAGAFGGETKDSVSEVLSLDTRTYVLNKRNRGECEFSYRNSVFRRNRSREIVLEVVFSLIPGEKEEILNKALKNIEYRQARQPLEHPNIGSIFKNVQAERISPEVVKLYGLNVKTDPFPVIPTARLIAEAGLRGLSLGGAMISPKHPNFIVNVLNASSRDVSGLIAVAKDAVNRKFGVRLEEEILNLAS
ncbi:MAG: UDP-N-acetylmuramate dehydrogenase [Patescibacteria group bacterium]|nr:UDP-N-acetylmuramate dehydrogenase [Patescibacteria group bacterium]